MKPLKLPSFIGAAVLFAVFSLTTPAGAQETFDFTIPEPEKKPLAPENPEALPRRFHELSLDMGLEDLKTALKNDDLFTFRGDRDVSFLPVKEQTLVETTGLSFIRRAFFQLIEGKVFIMAFSLDTKLVDHYSVFTSFVKKYGNPAALSPSETVWENDETRVSIERPLTVKYIDKTAFNRVVEESKTLESRQLFLTQEFLDAF
ncbi:MAG: hypothetical protein LBC62_07430 [Treponema sp.]|jgi:hypothetical protein|nr:hypothetical protein [Treponema sp.]